MSKVSTMKVLLTETNPVPETVPSLDRKVPLHTVSSTEDIPMPERTSKLTIVGRYRNDGYTHAIVPEIRFGGRYLEAFKFLIGTRLRISVKKGRIIIKPDRYQPWLPEEIAREVREASAIDNT